MNRIKHFNHNKIDKRKLYAYGLPEHSLDKICDSLPKLIKASGATQKELAKALRISTTTIANYCDGSRTRPEKKFLQDIADYFDIKPSYFLEYRGHQLRQRLINNPELIDVFLDLATTPVRIIAEWNKVQNDISKYDDYVSAK